MKRMLRGVISYFSFIFLLVGVNGLHLEARPIKVVACNTIIADWVNKLAWEIADVDTIVPLDGDSHNFEPSARDATHIAKADVIFEIGLGYEFWLDGLYESSGSKAERVELAQYVQHLMEVPCGAHHCAHHHHSDVDPHVWLNPKNVMDMVRGIADVLIKIDPKNKDQYKASEKRYLDELQKLHEWIQGEVKKLPKENKKLVTNHDNFGYFANEYGFEVIGSVLGSVSTDSMDPSASQFVGLIRKIRKNDVKAVFAENIQSSALVSRLAAEVGLAKPKILYTEALSGISTPAESYIEMMRSNVRNIVSGLSQK